METTTGLASLIDFADFGQDLLTALGGVIAVYLTFKGVVIAYKWGMRKISGLISRA